MIYIYIYNNVNWILSKKNEEKFLKKTCERYQGPSEEEKSRSVDMLMSTIKILLKMKRKKLIKIS